MKKSLAFLLLALVACNQPKSVEAPDPQMDSLISRSNIALEEAEKVHKQSDSVSGKTVEKVIFKIKYLTNEVEKYKLEKIMLTNALKISSEKVRIDTVYIEKRRNFWGKEKTTVNVKSDSLQVDITDSLQTEEIKIDTTSHNY